MTVHVAVEEAQIRKFLPHVPRHLVEQRTLPIHNLVMRQRQNEVLGERVPEAESQLVMVMLPVDRVLGHVF